MVFLGQNKVELFFEPKLSLINLGKFSLEEKKEYFEEYLHSSPFSSSKKQRIRDMLNYETPKKFERNFNRHFRSMSIDIEGKLTFDFKSRKVLKRSRMITDVFKSSSKILDQDLSSNSDQSSESDQSSDDHNSDSEDSDESMETFLGNHTIFGLRT